MSEATELEASGSELIARDLNFQQEQFALEWLANGGNGTKAAIAAGYGSPDVTASRLLRHPRVSAFIEARRAERRAELDLKLREKHMSPDELVAMLADMARFDLGDVLDGQGRVDRSKLKAMAKQLQAVEIDGAKTKIKGPDRAFALRMIADILGLTSKNQVNVQVNVGFAERMAARRAKLAEGG